MQSCLLVHLAERLVAHLQLEDRPAEAGQGALLPTRDDVEGARAEGSHAKQGEMSLATSSHQLTALSGVAAMLFENVPSFPVAALGSPNSNATLQDPETSNGDARSTGKRRRGDGASVSRP